MTEGLPTDNRVFDTSKSGHREEGDCSKTFKILKNKSTPVAPSAHVGHFDDGLFRGVGVIKVARGGMVGVGCQSALRGLQDHLPRR